MTTFLTDLFKRYEQRRFIDTEVTRAVELIKSVIGKHRQTTYVSFNGGKDATVVLFLTALAYHEQAAFHIKTLFFVEPQPFEEVDEFMESVHEMVGYQELQAGRDFKQALHELKQNHQIDNIIMGSRRTDPYCQSLQVISQSDTDKGYPQFDRVNPIIDWTYSQVWSFLRNYELPFCKLYELGYTYLGNKSNTKKNPQLQESKKYKPAWEAPDNTELLSRK